MRFLGLDAGTSACKALLVDESGRRHGFARIAYPPSTTQLAGADGRREADPEVWWQAARLAIAACLRESDEPPAALGLTGATLVPILVDAAGHLLRPAIRWDDTRAIAEAAELRARLPPERLREALGADFPISPAWPLPRLLWLRRHEPAVLERAAGMLQPKDYLALLLTGEIGSDPASCRGLVNLLTGQRPDDLLAALDLPAGVVPPQRPPHAVLGMVREGLGIPGLPAGVPVAVGTADFPAALLGLGLDAPGEAFHVAGTTDHLGLLTERRPPSGSSHPLLWAPDEATGVLYGVISSGGGAWQWFCDAFAVDPSRALAEAATAPAGADGLLFLPYLRGERTPHWNPRARGAFFGLTAGHQRAHLARAVLEGVALALRRVLELVDAQAGQRVALVRAGGGPAATGAGLWNRIKANSWKRPLAIAAEPEISALGAATLAARAMGVHLDRASAAGAMCRAGEVVEATPAEVAVYEEVYPRYQALDAALSPLF